MNAPGKITILGGRQIPQLKDKPRHWTENQTDDEKRAAVFAAAEKRRRRQARNRRLKAAG